MRATSEPPHASLRRATAAARAHRRRDHAARAVAQLHALAATALREALLQPPGDPVVTRRIVNIEQHVMNGGATMDMPDPQDTDLLIVDDDDALREEIAAYLADHGFTVHQARDAGEARATLKAAPIAVMVLDVMLPGEDGLSVAKSLAGGRGPAILMLSSMGDSIDRILGLELGADDYVVKPVPPRELLARVRALIRRRTQEGAPAARSSAYVFAGFRFDVVRRQLKAPDGDVLMLTPGELSLMCALVENPGRVLTRDKLVQLTRGEDAQPVDRAIDIQISRLRRKLNAKTRDEVIKTHRGVGYLLDARVTQA